MSVFTKNKKGYLFTKYRFVSMLRGSCQTSYSLDYLFEGGKDEIGKQAMRQLENNLRVWL